MGTLFFIIFALLGIIVLCAGYLLLDWLTERPPATHREVRSRCSGHRRRPRCVVSQTGVLKRGEVTDAEQE